MNTATLRLFRAILVRNKEFKKVSEELNKKTLLQGFLFSPEVVAEFDDSYLANLASTSGITPTQMNASFHKSWNKVKTAPLGQLIIEQILHYITTYGFEALGIYNPSAVYIPKEKLEIPDIDLSEFKITVIHGICRKELHERVIELLQSGIALKEDTLNDLFNIITKLDMNINPEDIKNKEMKIKLYDFLKIVPQNPIEFLRYVLYKSTGSTLIIKNAYIITKIKTSDKQEEVVNLFKIYETMHGLSGLATIFLRYKPLFLAFKSNGLANTINRIRKLADKHHTPMKPDLLNDVTSILTHNKINLNELDAALEKVNTFRKIRLAYALKYRTNEDFDSIQYKIRNGKSYATSFKTKNPKEAKEILKIVTDSIISDLAKKVEGKKIYIPDYMTYTLPATEKMFTGNFSSGSYVTLPKDIVFGIHWNNIKKDYASYNYECIDLDLSLLDHDKIGWDANYRSINNDILFSGDMTDAPMPNGASELFYVQRQIKKCCLLFVNYYNFNADFPVPFSIIIGNKLKAADKRSKFMIDPNSVLARAESVINCKEKLLGLMITTTKECRFYFNESNFGGGITAKYKKHIEQGRQYFINYVSNMITLNDLLSKAGAVLVDTKTEDALSLAPEDLEKDTIINLLT